MQVGSAVAKRGDITRGFLELGQYPDGGPVNSPVMIVQGNADGPVLWVQGSLHGPEVVGPLAIQSFLRSLDVSQLKGTVVALMFANPLGMRGYNRLTPQDGVNLNRVFPGDPAGTVSEQLAHRLLDVSLSTADVLLDLHSGGDLTITCHYTLYHDTGTEQGRESGRLARASGAPNVWNSCEEGLSGCMFTHFTKGGKPALIVEHGGGARITEADLAAEILAINNVCRALGMLPGEPQPASRFRLGGNAAHIKSTTGGLFVPLVQPGDDVVEGQPLGNVVNGFGDIVETPVSPLKQAWIGSIRRPYMPIYNGDQVIEIVETLGYE
ncbi:MAG: succinylglutamate desuccinylase/aspartoacylase family protein [Rhodobiaceae bacterium]|nr:succinylglutamate desuccinylase/aspartoacylase family protein [Rhodobiaceae bacterium]